MTYLACQDQRQIEKMPLLTLQALSCGDIGEHHSFCGASPGRRTTDLFSRLPLLLTIHHAERRLAPMLHAEHQIDESFR